MPHSRTLIATASLVLTAAAAPASGPSFDCEAAASAAEHAVCTHQGLASLDRRLAATFREAVDVAEAVGDAETALPRLRAEQRGWVKGRDACWKAEAGVAPCVEAAYRDRIAELQAEWMLVEPAPPKVFRCDDRSEVVLREMASDTPTARIQRGDTTVVAHLRDATSARFYEGPFGFAFVVSGETADAVFDQNDPPLRCHRVD